MTITGEWYAQSSRPLMRSQGAVSQDVASCDLGVGIVTSEKATTALRTHSVFLHLEGATATDAPGQVRPCSTTNAAWRTPVAVSVVRVLRYGLALEEMATCDNFVLYGNAGTCIGGILLSAGTTNPPAYTRTAIGALTLTNLPAGTDVLIQRLSSTCSVQSRSVFQLDYETSG